ncbi:putative cytochrome b561 ferric reductase transmembrane [Golovinomyces cichoracearum]|uniref:Putative cytochrome b561 ferric reductase transmembrane n=1 Tax=Golovinomyces cichoracearum TaxID=62708 RepID=A0A420IZ07_9PEZI|nr:putative cytochrome b561 ferric reductase transmembrane [Golovinomyces cichoracearum]
MAPANSFSPAGSSTYSSNTMYVGDGTWVASKNTFLLPNLVGMNFETMRFNGMGNRFATLSQYHSIISAHGILAVATFLFLVPAAILIAQFRASSRSWALRLHIYLQILTILLSTAVFTLGWFAVGPSRSFTNPHHGIGMAIYVLILVQGFSGYCIYHRSNYRSPRKQPLLQMLHEWIGKATALLGFAQVALGLTLYGSPKYTFVLYAIWMAFLLIIFFILKYRNRPVINDERAENIHNSTMMEDSKPNRFKGPFNFFSLKKEKTASRNNYTTRNRRPTNDNAGNNITSRHTSQTRSHNYTDDKKRKGDKEGSSFMKKIIKIAAIAGIISTPKDESDVKKREGKDEKFSVMSLGPPPRPARRDHDESEINRTDDLSNHLEEEQTRISSALPDRRQPINTTTLTNTSVQRSVPASLHRHDSYGSETNLDNTMDPNFERKESSMTKKDRILRTLSLGYFAKKTKSGREHELHERERLAKKRIREERTQQLNNVTRSRPHEQDYSDSSSSSSDLSLSDNSQVTASREENNLPISLMPGTSTKIPESRQNIGGREILEMPSMPPERYENLHSESNISSQIAPQTQHHRRDSLHRSGESQGAAIAAATEAARVVVSQEERQKNQSRVSGVSSNTYDDYERSISVKVKVHDDKNHVTLRRLTREEAAAEREARIADRQRRRAESLSSMSAIDTAASHRRYRRSESETGRQPDYLAPAISRSHAPATNSSIAAGQKSIDKTYYPPKQDLSRSAHLSVGQVGSSDGQETWSAMSPGNDDNGEAAAERRRRRRLERSQKSVLSGEGAMNYNATGPDYGYIIPPNK